MSRKGHRPWGWLKEWHIAQEKSCLVVAVLLSIDGYVISNTCAWILDQAKMWEVGDVTYMFHLGEGLPPGVLKSRGSERTEAAILWIAFRARRRAPIPEKTGSYFMRISASSFKAGDCTHAALTETTTVSSSGQI